jgi:hypothetical protein
VVSTVQTNINNKKTALLAEWKATYDAAVTKYNTDLAEYNRIAGLRTAYNTAVTSNASLLTSYQSSLSTSRASILSTNTLATASRIVADNPLDFQAQIDQLNALCSPRANYTATTLAAIDALINQAATQRDALDAADGANPGAINLNAVRTSLASASYSDAVKQVDRIKAQLVADKAAYDTATGVAKAEKLIIVSARQAQLDAANARLSTIRANDLDNETISGGEAYIYQFADRIKQFVTNAPDPLTYGNTRISIGGEMRSLKDIDADLKRNFGISFISGLVGNSISDTTSITRDQLKGLVNAVEALSMSSRFSNHFLGLGYNITPTSFLGSATSQAQLVTQLTTIFDHGAIPKPDNVGMGLINGKPVVLSGDALAANRVQYWLASTNIGRFTASSAGDGTAPLFSNTPGTAVLTGDDPYNPGHQISFADLMDKIKAEPARGTIASDASQKVNRFKELIQEARSTWPTTEPTPRKWMQELGFNPSSDVDVTAFKDLVNTIAPSLNVNSWGLTTSAGSDVALSNSITLSGLTTALTGFDDRGTSYINSHNQAPTEDPVILATLGPNWRTQGLNITQVTQLATALDPIVGHGCKIPDILLTATDPAGRSFTGTKAAVALLETGLQALIDAGTASGNGGRFPWTATYTADGKSYSLQGIDQLAQRLGLGNLVTQLILPPGSTATPQGLDLKDLQALMKGLGNFNGANTPLQQGDGFGNNRSGSALQEAINSALNAANVAQATRDNPDGNPYTVNMNWMLDGSEPARQDFTFHNLDDATDFENVKATLQSFQFVDVDSAQAPSAVRAAAFAAPNTVYEAPLSTTEIKQQISGGDLYIDSRGVFYLNRQRTNARDLVVGSRLVAGDRLEDQLTGLMNNINNRNVDIQIAKELETCTTEAEFTAKLTSLKTKYGVDDVLSRITGGSQTDSNYGTFSSIAGILQGVIDVKTKDAELDQQNLQNLNNQIEANNTAMTTLLNSFEELMKGLIQALH